MYLTTIPYTSTYLRERDERERKEKEHLACSGILVITHSQPPVVLLEQ